MDNFPGYRLTCEFEYKRKNYIAYVCPFYELSDYEMRAYDISEFTYVVHLFSFEGFKTFEMFPDEDLRWTTNASELLVNRGIVNIIAYVLVNAFR